MNTAEIVKELAQKHGKTKREVKQVIETTVGVLAENLTSERGFTFPGLGTFGTRLRAARNAFNPALKAIVKLAPVKAVFFHPAVSLKQRAQETET